VYKDGFKPIVSIVIPVHNEADKTIACLKSIRANTKLPYEIVWVDNGSHRDQLKSIRVHATKPHMHCKLVRNDTNMGFVHATNQGINEAEGDYIILLNNDTTVNWKWESKLIKPLMNDAKVGAVGPVTQSKIAWQEAVNLNRRWNLTLPVYSTITAETYPHKLSEQFADKYVDVGKLPLSFFCVAMRKKTIDDIGLLCESFSIGLGDDDEYCFRLRAHGYKLMLSLGTFVHHWHRTTFTALKIGVDSLRRYNLKILKQQEKETMEKVKDGRIKPIV
jgi:GT2 family glycosyltransferase